MKNNKGLTVIEMLITLSVSSIVLMMLMGITSNIIFTRNAIEYTNRLDDEIFEMTQTIQDLKGDSIYSTVYQPEAFEGSVVLITREFNPDISDSEDKVYLNRNVFRIDILFLDVETQSIYYALLYELEDNVNDVNETIANYLEEQEDEDNQLIKDVKAFVDDPLDHPNSRRIISSRIKVMENSTMTLRSDEEDFACSRTLNNLEDDSGNKYISDTFDIDNFVSLCLSTYIDFDLQLSYELHSGNKMPTNQFETTIFVP